MLILCRSNNLEYFLSSLVFCLLVWRSIAMLYLPQLGSVGPQIWYRLCSVNSLLTCIWVFCYGRPLAAGLPTLGNSSGVKRASLQQGWPWSVVFLAFLPVLGDGNLLQMMGGFPGSFILGVAFPFD